MPDNPKRWTLRTLSRFLALVTVVATAWIGFAPISLSGHDADVQCNPLLGSVSARTLVTDLEDSRLDEMASTEIALSALEERLLGALSQASEQAHCVEARQGRLAWLTIVFGLGTALTLAAALAYRRDPEEVGSPAISSSATEIEK